MLCTLSPPLPSPFFPMTIWCVCRRGGHREPDESQSIGAEEPPPPHPQWERVWGAAQRSVHLFHQPVESCVTLSHQTLSSDIPYKHLMFALCTPHLFFFFFCSQGAGRWHQSRYLHPSPWQRRRHQERESRYQQTEEWYEVGKIKKKNSEIKVW